MKTTGKNMEFSKVPAPLAFQITGITVNPMENERSTRKFQESLLTRGLIFTHLPTLKNSRFSAKLSTSFCGLGSNTNAKHAREYSGGRRRVDKVFSPWNTSTY